jgi:aspartyl/glutamyl-tRNA(Asn/Gln) amidotransferase C subunit
MILKRTSIRDVIAFPKNRKAICPMSQAPADVEQKQLDELGINIGAHAAQFSAKRHGAGAEVIEKENKEKISVDDVHHVAKLARLRLSGSEVEAYQEDLNSILTYVEALEEIDTRRVAPMSHVMESKNIWREDTPTDTGRPEDLLTNAPMSEKGCFKVPRILDNN